MNTLRKKVVVAAAGLAIVLGGAGSAVAFAGSDAEPTQPIGCSPSAPLKSGEAQDQPGKPIDCSQPVLVEPGTPHVPGKPVHTLPIEVEPGTPHVPAKPADE